MDQGVRPDYEQYARNIELCAQGIRNADTMETVRREPEKFWDYRIQVETMAFIRCYQDCTNAFYQEEMQNTQSQAAMTDLSPIYDALLESPPTAGDRRRIRQTVSVEDREGAVLMIENE